MTNRRPPAFVLAFAAAMALAVFPLGCNAILDNEDGTLGTDGGDLGSDAAADATTPPELDATVLDARSDADAHALLDGAVDAPPDAAADTGPNADDAGDASMCGANQQVCAGACVSTTDPVYGCGAGSCAPCSLARGIAGCSGSTCVLASCDPGYADCNLDPSDGCETDLSLPGHCGSCNASCGASAPDCAPVNGTFECITGCTPAEPTLCSAGTCVDLTSSPTNCGMCGHVCPAIANSTSTCGASTCGFTCTTPFQKCGAGCVGPQDPTACGPTCTACPPVPNAAATCPASACSFTCNAGYGDCDMDPTNGCEAKLMNKKCPVPVPDAGVDAGPPDAGPADSGPLDAATGG